MWDSLERPVCLCFIFVDVELVFSKCQREASLGEKLSSPSFNNSCELVSSSAVKKCILRDCSVFGERRMAGWGNCNTKYEGVVAAGFGALARLYLELSHDVVVCRVSDKPAVNGLCRR